MILITKGVQKDIRVTLTESVTLLNPFFLFEFTNVSTKDTLKVIVSSADDRSDYQQRFNSFDIDIALFEYLQTGQYSYDVYEQLSDINTNTEGLNLIETGKMLLVLPGEKTAYQSEYAPTTKFV